MHEEEQAFSLKSLFVPLTTLKAIHIIAIVGFLVFGNALFNGFVGDDVTQIVNNPSVHSFSNLLTYFSGSTFYNGGTNYFAGVYYKPFLSTYFSIIYTFFGPNYIAFHFFQILLHIVNACIIFLFFKHFFRKSVSLILALVFLVHPINSESVFYISAAQEVLFFFFGMLALWILINFRSKKSTILASMCLFFSLLSKETGILFIGTSILYLLFFNKNRAYIVLGFLIPTIAAYTFLRIHAVGILTKSMAAPIDQLNLLERSFNMPLIFFFYIKTFLFPLNLASSYQWAYTYISYNHFFLPSIVDFLFIVVIASVPFLYKKDFYKYFKTYIFFASWFLLGMLFHLQLIPLDVTVAERWFYFPIVGVLGMMGFFLGIFNSHIKKKWIFTVVGILLLLLSARTIIRSFDWRNDFTLASRDIKVSPDAYDLEAIISNELIKQGKFKEAKIHAEQSVRLYPYLTTYNILGLVYLGLGDYKKAKEAYLNALKFGDYYITYENLAGLTLITGDPNKNIHFIRAALKKFPQDARLWLYLAVLEYRTGNINAAKNAIVQAYFYNQNSEVSFVYKKIMNNQPLNLKFTTGSQ